MSKCEHGLTSKECLVCASPKYGAHLAPVADDELPEPVAWIRSVAEPQPHCVTSLRYLSIADTDAGMVGECEMRIAPCAA